MNGAELAAAVYGAERVFRVETLGAYDSDSDGDFVDRYLGGAPKPDPSEKEDWLGRIGAARAAGRPWRRLRVIPRPITDYVRYACEWGYVDNVGAGEDVRVLDMADAWSPEAQGVARFGDFYVLDGVLVAMQYDERGRFVSAEGASSGEISAESAAAIVAEADSAFGAARDFTEWWASNPDLHRGHYAAV